ncbi:hypothetical protein GCM10011409_36700 [Lentibacillus populi]|uniref:Uncharacterized protein n=1 Tax=Lentibacillus populi TaxID=1827502 RepID=A0A9W5U0F9_9BACI|nr:hypothetical protein GCM10011409_36700 [Lentibacillus populi]
MEIIKQSMKEPPYLSYIIISVLSFATFGKIKWVEMKKALLKEKVQEYSHRV